jgi:hypothetical protein
MTMPDQPRSTIQRKRQKAENLANDRNAPAGERSNARAVADKLQIKLDKASPAAYRDLVKQGKVLIEEQVNINWKLGELASQVDKEYGSGKLQDFADDIDVNYSTLKNCRTTFLAYPEKARRRAFSVCSALNPHPRRLDILEKNPSLTTRQARTKMAEYNAREAIKSIAAPSPSVEEADADASGDANVEYCSFCGKSRHTVDVCLCDDCMEQMKRALAK